MGQQIRDEAGRVLGYFLSEAEYTRAIQENAEADIARREAEARASDLLVPDAVVDRPGS